MGGARTDGGHSVTGPIHKKSIAITEKEMLTEILGDLSFIHDFATI